MDASAITVGGAVELPWPLCGGAMAREALLRAKGIAFSHD
jgi:hypothetical protein